MSAAEIWPENLASSTIDALEGANALWSSLPFHYVFIGHALFCTLAGPEFKSKWLVHLLVSQYRISPAFLQQAPQSLTRCLVHCS